MMFEAGKVEGSPGEHSYVGMLIDLQTWTVGEEVWANVAVQLYLVCGGEKKFR